MPMERVTDRLSEEGQAVMLRGFAAGRTAAFIAQAVKDATGEEVSERTVARLVERTGSAGAAAESFGGASIG